MTRLIAGADVFVEGELRPLDIVIDGETITGLVARGTGPTDAEVDRRRRIGRHPRRSRRACPHQGTGIHPQRGPDHLHPPGSRRRIHDDLRDAQPQPADQPPSRRCKSVFDLYAEKSIVDYNHNPAATIPDEIAPMAAMGVNAYKIYMVVDTRRTYPHPAGYRYARAPQVLRRDDGHHRQDR